MKLPPLYIFVLLALALGSCCAVAYPSDGSSSDESDAEIHDVGQRNTRIGDDDEENDVVQENPFYEDGSSEDRAAASSRDALESRKESKAAISKVLGVNSNSTTTTTQKGGGGVLRRRAATLLRRHGLKITLLLAVFAFRKELQALAWQLCSRPVRDPETGAWVRRPAPPSPTAILKILVFVDLMRRLESGSSGGSNDGPRRVSPLAALLLAGGGRGNPALAALLSRLWEPSNAAYIPPVEQHYTFERINNRYNRDADALRKVLNQPSAERSATSTAPSRFSETVVILDWTNLDSSLSQLGVLRDEVSFLLSQYRNESWSDSGAASPASPLGSRGASAVAPPALRGSNPSVEILVVLESPGGSASEYALAAQQILRLRHRGLNVTVCVDKVAASGGYMIACTASPGRLLAAPLAVVGSIGVVGQSLNVHKALRGWGVEPLVFRGGRDKAPVGLIGEVTEEGLQKVQKTVDNVHRAFQRHVADARPALAGRMEELATGDVWLACDALELGLVDRLVTSDEYVEERLSEGARVLKLTRLVRPKYPFGRPTTTTAATTVRERRPGLAWPLASDAFASEAVQAFLRRASDALRDLVGDVSSLSTCARSAAPSLSGWLGTWGGGTPLC